MNKRPLLRYVVRMLVVFAVLALISLALVSIAEADGFFARCQYLNNCETFATEFFVTNHKNGILVEGEIPDADLTNTANPVELIVTTGDVYTLCSNTHGLEKVTGDILWRGDVEHGWFSMYIPLQEGEYNITVYMGQSVCANCPQAWVFPITVKHKPCEWEMYVLKGTQYDCYLTRNRTLGDMKTELPSRFDGTDYMQSLCALYDCTPEGWVKRLDFGWTGRWTTTCKTPQPCTACP